jgi:beta-glucuronidase
MRAHLRLPLVLATAAIAAFGAAGPAAAQDPATVTPPVTGPGPEPADAPAVAPVDTPRERSLYKNGPSGRHLLAGGWLFRLDKEEVGVKEGFQTQTTTAGWKSVKVPYAWNAGDDSPESMAGTVGWYRKEFRLPSAAKRLSWVVRFESVNYRSRVWLNGVPVGKNRGAYLPFEIRLPASVLKRGGVNRLVIRADSRRFPTDFPPSGLSVTGRPTGGWWNYGGILREVYLRKIDGIDFNSVQVTPDLPCATCSASVRYKVTLRNFGDRAQRVKLTGRLGGQKVALGSAVVGAKRFVTFVRSVRVGSPRLWSPGSPNLYDASMVVTAGKQTLQRYRLKIGIRSIKVSDGKLLLNGKPVNFRGFGVHEDSLKAGFAIDNKVRDQLLDWTQEAGATLLRAHYPLHPYMLEEADRRGIMVWSEVPVYAVKTKYLKQRLVRQLAARELESNILTNGNHPSVVTWSIGNELSARPGPVQGFYIARAARAAKALDPSRPVSYAVAGYPSAGCQPEYGPLDIIGVNEYFGWYPGPNGQIADRTLLSEYLDGVRACYPKKALVVSEFGAEANRPGPVEEKGTYEHQQDFVNYHLGVYATKPYLSGAIYWALQEFRVRPFWDGGNPRPMSPIHQKGVIAFDGNKKPAFADIQRNYKATVQYGAGPAR